jgi:hypothetical protein
MYTPSKTAGKGEGGAQRYLYTLDRKRADKNDILVERET